MKRKVTPSTRGLLASGILALAVLALAVLGPVLAVNAAEATPAEQERARIERDRLREKAGENERQDTLGRLAPEDRAKAAEEADALRRAEDRLRPDLPRPNTPIEGTATDKALSGEAPLPGSIERLPRLGEGRTHKPPLPDKGVEKPSEPPKTGTPAPNPR